MTERVAAIVPAAGLGKRFGPGTNKPFRLLLDKPLIVWTLEALQNIDEIEEIIPVLKESDMELGVKVFESHNLTKITRIAPGGRERQDSVYHGLKLIDGKADIVLIHDGCRPLIDREIVLEAINNIKGFDGAIVAVPVKDTIKEAENSIVKQTIKREALWQVQTPQVFRYSSIMKAYDKAMAEGFYSTDDSALIEKLGGRVRIIMGSYDNIKVTTPEDIPIAEILLKKRLKDI